MRSGIYIFTNIKNGKVLVGSSKDVTQRQYKHTYRLRKGDHVNQHFLAAWRRYGSDAFSYDIVEYCTLEHLIKREQWWIDLLGSMDSRKGYNKFSASRHETSVEARAKISAANKGRVHTPEARANMSAAHTGKPGVPHTLEAKAKISAARLGKSNSPEMRAKLSTALSGRRLSDDHRRHISKARMGRVSPMKGRSQTPEARARISASMKAYREKQRGELEEAGLTDGRLLVEPDEEEAPTDEAFEV